MNFTKIKNTDVKTGDRLKREMYNDTGNCTYEVLSVRETPQQVVITLKDFYTVDIKGDKMRIEGHEMRRKKGYMYEIYEKGSQVKGLAQHFGSMLLPR